MIVTQNNKELRNLQEQVLKNKEDIARHYEIDRTLANLGIEIVGQVETPEDLPNPATYTGSFGDTYAVGNKVEVDAGTARYMYYVYTRPDINAGQPFNYWLNVGSISIVGPQGVQGPIGPQGPKGEAGAKWNSGAYPNITGNINDYYLVTTGGSGYIGDVYRITEGGPIYMGNIRGPQGLQGIQGPAGLEGPQGAPGPKGEPGDVGGFINIWGILSNINQAPTPASLNNLTVAYLVGAAAPYDLYVQIGESSDTAIWTNMGPFNAATLVTIDGVGQNVWDAGTKVDKVETAANEVYVHKHNIQGTVAYSSGITNNVIVARSGLDVLVPDTPGRDNAATSKKYVDNGFVSKVTTSGSYQRIYGISPQGEPYIFNVGETTLGYSIAKRLSDGGLLVPQTPGGNSHAASKKYVDDNKGTKLYEHEITGVSGTATTGETITKLVLVTTSSASITGGGETGLSLLYLDSINSYIPYYGKITYILDYFMNQVTVQFHNRLNGGEVESMILDVENMVDTVTAL